MKGQWGHVISYMVIAVMALAVGVGLILLMGSDLGRALPGFVRGIIGSPYNIGEVLVKTVPLTLCGLGIAVGFRSGFINLGAEGQLYVGAIAATAVSLWLPGLPGILLLPLMVLAAFVAGGLWALVPGFLKGRFGISEIIVTIMFNYIAINLTGVLVRTVLRDPEHAFPVSPRLPEAGLLPKLIPMTRLHAGLILALGLAVLVYVLVWKTPLGFQMRAVGMNPRACQCSGISVYRSIILASVVSGGLAGIAGMGEVAGLHGRLLEGISPDYGYVAIIVALLGNRHPLGVVIAAVGIASLQVGSLSMQRAAGVPTAISTVLMGLIVLLILARKPLFGRFLGKGKEVV